VTPELWQKVRQTLDALLVLEPGPRAQQLAQLRRDEPTLAAEVDSLLGRRDTPHSGEHDSGGDRPAPTTREGDRQRPAGPTATEPLTHIGLYSLQEKVGQGGMGIVWRARDRLFRRSLAVKVLAEQHTSNSELRRRFVEEAQLMGQLQHPGIPPVHDLGELPDGRPYFAMKLIKGKTLAALLKERTGPDQEQPRLLAIFEQVCQTLAYAHAQRILHRDLKPSNIMVGAFGEVQVMDWGLAKLLGSAGEKTEQAVAPASTIYTVRTDEPDTATQTGQALGTPAYMAPEQARGETGLLDERCDVFGLGAILCEILTGQPAFIGRNTKEVLHSAQEGDTTVALTRLEKSGADRELVQLARRCLAADRHDRPAHAGAVAQALTDHLAQVRERLRQAELERKAAEVRAAEERKRRRVAFRLGSVIALLVLVLGVAGWWMDRSRTRAQQEEEERQARGRQAVESLFEQVDLALAGGKADRAEPALRLVRQRLADLDADDLKQRLVESEKDLVMLRELERLFFRRWLVMQQVVLEQLQSGQREGVLTKAPARAAAGFAPLTSRAELRQEYAAAFARHGLPLGHAPGTEWFQSVHKSRIQKALIDALDQWFLLEPESAALLAALNALDRPHAAARQLVAERAAGKQPGTEPARIDGERHEPTAVLYLSELLPDEQAITLLAKTIERLPDDYRLLTVLVYRLLLSEPTRAAEAVGYARAAHALQPKNAFACLLVAVVLSEDHQWDEAIAHAQQAIELDPGSADAHSYIGYCYNEKGDYAQAIPHLKMAIKLDPKHIRAHNNLGYSYRMKGDHDLAIAYLLKAIQLDPNYALAHGNLGLVYTNDGDHDQALLHLKKAVELDPKNATSQSNVGFVYNNKEQYDQAIPCLEEAIKLDPKNAFAHNNLGFSYMNQGKAEQAIVLLKKAVELDPKNVPAHGNLGNAYCKIGKYDEALLHLKRAIEIDPKNPKVRSSLGFAYNEKGDYDQAIPHLEKAIALDATNSQAHNNLGYSYRMKGDHDRAIVSLQKAIELDPRNALAYGNLGLVYSNKGDYDQALLHLKKAVELDPKNAQSQCNVGFVYNNKAEFDQAIPYLEKAIALDPANSQAHNNLGYSYRMKGDHDRAIASLQKAIELDPRNAQAHGNLGLVHSNKGDYDQALPHLKKAVALEPKNAASHSNVGFVYNNKGEYDRAVPYLKHAIELDPSHALAHNNLGFSYRMKGDCDRAIACFKKALELDPKNTYLPANLGLAYRMKGEHEQAIAQLKKAIELDPKNANTHENYGVALFEAGRLTAARDVFLQALELTAANSPQVQARQKALKALDALVKLEPRLEDIVKCQLKPRDYLEAFQFGRLCRVQQYVAAASRLYEQALTLEPAIAKKLLPGDVLALARTNVLAGAGQGNDPPPQAERPAYRARALPWLRQYLKVHQLALEKNPNNFRYIVQQNIRLLLQHHDFASVHPTTLDNLPEDERQQWQTFWKDVQMLLERADASADNGR
jgi:tetratricopeptide (TPR) repeat protein/serine/threonine protein kinase